LRRKNDEESEGLSLDLKARDMVDSHHEDPGAASNSPRESVSHLSTTRNYVNGSQKSK
jgi:hypothetical protein